MRANGRAMTGSGTLLEDGQRPCLASLGGLVEDRVGRFARTNSGGLSVPGRMERSFGGAAFNACRTAAALGVRVALRAPLDEAGRRAAGRAALAAGVSLTADETAHALPSYTALVQPNGGLFGALADMEALERWRPGCPWAHVDAAPTLCLVDANLAAPTLRDAIASAPAPVAAMTVSTDKAIRLLDMLQDIALILTNRAEAEALVGRFGAPTEAAERLVRRGAGAACVTDGAQGAAWASPDGSGVVPAARATIVDVIGAGDAFAGAVLAALARRVPLPQAVTVGVRAAAIAIGHAGAWSPDFAAAIGELEMTDAHA